jgi:N6-adenosine-specific RNA methylase IME4
LTAQSDYGGGRERSPAKAESAPAVLGRAAGADGLKDPERAGSYATVVADPPWRYDNVATRNAAERQYETMDMAELKRLPLYRWAAAQAHLYLWTTANFLPRAFSLLEAWGFTYVTNLVWVKPQMGLGNYFRVSHEHVLFGRRGKLRTRSRSLGSVFTADRTRHSAKPDSFYDLVEQASFPPYLEMFARRRRLSPEWDYWGDEA